jgi:phage baseplate assembly protein W
VANANTNLGSCWSCVSDITSPAIMVSGNLAVSQAIARRLQTPRGNLIDDPNYGTDLTAYLLDDITPGQLNAIQTAVNQECLKDQRVTAASSTVQLIGTVLIVSIALQAGAGPFSLVLSVSQVAANPVQILSVS